MKIQLFLLGFLILGISYLLPKTLVREPFSVDIPIKVRFLAFLVPYLMREFVPPRFTRWIQSLKSPQSTDEYEVQFKFLRYLDEVNSAHVKIQLNIYSPRNLPREESEKLPILLYFHGGGFVIGHPNSVHPFFDEIMKQDQKMIIVSPNYRKHPEWKVDDSIRDGLETLRHVKKKMLFSKERKIIISGESAGGKLSLALSYYLKKTNYKEYSKSMIHTVPISGVFCKNLKCRENSEFKNGYLESEKFMKDFHGEDGSKVSIETEQFNFDPFKDTSNLPNMTVITAEYDYLRDEALKWVNLKNQREDEKVEYICIKGEIHGFLDPSITLKKSSISKVAKIISEISKY